jgi:nucleotide-binding universal stress UspA family protein
MSPTPIQIHRILVPHDFSETAERALSMALSLAKSLGASVVVMHAYEVPAFGFPEGPVMTADLVGQIERATQGALDAVAARAREGGIQVDSTLRQGPTWSEINGAAQDEKADLIVLGTHGRRGLSRALLGSVAEKVVRTASCPVLTVRGPSSDN